MSLIANEQTKLTANVINTIASGTILAAFVAPYIGFGMGTSAPGSDWQNLAGLSTLGLVLGVIMHLIARRVLFLLEE